MIRALIRAWLASWLVLAWTTVAFAAGAAAMYLAIVADLTRRGVL